ncbi:hypothetical protein ACQV5M_21655, partial [Leptospira sp. SA-E8]|uniref:hypothetical protein n=1 Tax=Leptospira sp. SA-E8 TaxID=3422259 RepID=UPI003EBE4017
VERKELVFSTTGIIGAREQEHQFTRAVQAGERYAFDFLTIDTDVQSQDREVWAAYTGVAAWTATTAGDISITPRLNFSQPVNGGITLRIARNGDSGPSQSYTITAGQVAAGQPPMTLSVNAGDTLSFEYRTTDYALSSALADMGVVDGYRAHV